MSVPPVTTSTDKMKLAMPDITLAQVCAALTFIAGQAVTMGLADREQTKWILGIAITVVTAAWAVADAIIRHGRSRALANAPVGQAIVKDPNSVPKADTKQRI